MKRLTLTFTLFVLSVLLPARVRAQQVNCYEPFYLLGEAWVAKFNASQAAAEAGYRATTHLYTQAATFNCPELCPVVDEIGTLFVSDPVFTLLPDGRTLAYRTAESEFMCIEAE